MTNQEKIDRLHRDQAFKDLVDYIWNQKEGIEIEQIEYVIESAYKLGHLHGHIEALTD